jgi:putative transposase
MSQSLGHSNMHIVFSTKDRRPLIRADFEADLHAYICGICRSLKSFVHMINGMPDHVHILLEQHRTISLSELVGKIKANSSRWVKEHSNGDPTFSWQHGYGYFGVSRQQFDSVRQYILNQKEHHGALDYQDELRLAYTKNNIVFDERYVWD